MRQIRGKDKVIIIAVLVAVVCVSVVSVASSAKSPPRGKKAVPNKGSVRAFGIELYQTSEATDKTTSIDWGTLEPGTSKSVAVYVRNEGKKPVSLSYYTSGWNPSTASDFLNLGWDYDGQPLEVGETHQVTFRLSVSANVQGIETFSFDITVIGNE